MSYGIKRRSEAGEFKAEIKNSISLRESFLSSEMLYFCVCYLLLKTCRCAAKLLPNQNSPILRFDNQPDTI